MSSRPPLDGRVPCALTTAKVRTAQLELMLLGTAVMNNWQLTPSRFSLSALRDGLRADEFPPPPFKRCWCLRSMVDRRAVAIFLETENAFQVVAEEFGLEIHLCPRDPQFAVLARKDMVIHWPQTSTQGVRRTRQR